MAGDHKCPVCNATFTRPQHVARHMRSHTGDRPYKCQHCGDQFARSDLLSRHVNKCHASEKNSTTAATNRRKGSASASRATTSKQACDQCVVTNLPCDGSNPCSKCISRKCRCTFVKFHRQTAPVGPGHPAPSSLSSEKTSQHNHDFPMDVIISSDQLFLPQNSVPPLSVTGGNASLYHHNTMPCADFTFPASMYSRSSSLPVATALSDSQASSDQTSPDFAIRYRAQAELFSRAGVLPVHNQINLPSAVGQGSMHSNPRIGTSLTTGPPLPSSHQQSYNSDQRYSLSSTSWGNGRQPHESMNGIIYHSSRPNSQAGYPGSHPGNSSTSAADLYDFRFANREQMDDLSDSTSASTSEIGHSEHGHSSSDHSLFDSPTVLQNPPHQLVIPEQKRAFERNEGFSSAFGLMSLEDPNVLAGIASDGAPFFSNVDGGGESEPIILPQHMMTELKQVSTKLDESHEMNGTLGNGTSPRDAETRELRDFWKQYLRTPLSGPNSATNGFDLVTPTPQNFSSHGQLEEPAGKLSPSKKLSRISSMPSVKTPPLHSDVGAMTYHNPQSLVPNETGRINAATQPSKPGAYIHTQMQQDDLKCYEQAVLARKAPELNLIPRRKRTAANSGNLSGGGRFSSPSTASPSPVASHETMNGRSTSLSEPAISSRPSSADSNGSDRGSAARPSFKRLPSTTLGPANTKRTLLSVSGDEWSKASTAVGGQVPGATAESHVERTGGRSGGLTSEHVSDSQISTFGAREKHRRLSAPVVAQNLK